MKAKPWQDSARTADFFGFPIYWNIISDIIVNAAMGSVASAESGIFRKKTRKNSPKIIRYDPNARTVKNAGDDTLLAFSPCLFFLSGDSLPAAIVVCATSTIKPLF